MVEHPPRCRHRGNRVQPREQNQVQAGGGWPVDREAPAQMEEDQGYGWPRDHEASDQDDHRDRIKGLRRRGVPGRPIPAQAQDDPGPELPQARLRRQSIGLSHRKQQLQPPSTQIRQHSAAPTKTTPTKTTPNDLVISQKFW